MKHTYIRIYLHINLQQSTTTTKSTKSNPHPYSTLVYIISNYYQTVTLVLCQSTIEITFQNLVIRTLMPTNVPSRVSSTHGMNGLRIRKRGLRVWATAVRELFSSCWYRRAAPQRTASWSPAWRGRRWQETILTSERGQWKGTGRPLQQCLKEGRGRNGQGYYTGCIHVHYMHSQAVSHTHQFQQDNYWANLYLAITLKCHSHMKVSLNVWNVKPLVSA